MSYEQVLEFHNSFNVLVRNEPKIDVPEKKFRFKLIKEEVLELAEAQKDNNIVEIADALGDIIVVTYGAALTFGLDIRGLVGLARELSVDLQIYSNESNAFLSDEGRAYVLGMLEDALDQNDPKVVASVLTTIIVGVEYAALVLDIPLSDVVDAIHKSNMSKLGEDGKPVLIDYGGGDIKIGKGPNYQKPTGDIRKLLGINDA